MIRKRKILHILLSFLIAFGIWVYVVTVVSPESEGTFYNIPVVLTNESVLLDKGLMINSDDKPTVTLQLRGNRTDLITLKNSDITVVADLSKIHSPGQQPLNLDISFTGGNAFEIVNQTPSYITLQIAEWTTKKVPVQVDYTGNLGLDYIAFKDELMLDNDHVTITGPKEVVDRVSMAQITVDLEGQTESIIQNYRYTLCDESGTPVDVSGITTNIEEVNLNLKIQRVKEIQLMLDVTYGGGANPNNTVLTLSQQVIKVCGSSKALEDLDTIILGSINLSKIPEDTVMTFPIVLPEGIENLSGITEVEASISFPGLSTKVLKVDRIFVTGLPAGMNYEIGAKVVSVTVRGPQELLEQLTPEQVSILINLTDAMLGENLYKAQILLDDAYSQVGIIDSYSVLVTLTEATGEPANGTEG